MAELGSIVNGVVTKITSFGVFIDFADGESGLVHISELSHNYITDINEFIKKGDKVKAKVIKISDDGKISLSIKSAQQKPKPTSVRPDAFDWAAQHTDEMSFEDKLSRFKLESEEKIRDNKRRLDNRRSGGYSRKGL